MEITLKNVMRVLLLGALLTFVLSAPTRPAGDALTRGHHGRNFDWDDYFWSWGNDRCRNKNQNKGGNRRTSTTTALPITTTPPPLPTTLPVTTTIVPQTTINAVRPTINVDQTTINAVQTTINAVG